LFGLEERRACLGEYRPRNARGESLKMTVMNPRNFTPFADPLAEDEVKIELTWTADERTRVALERQSRLNGFQSITDYLSDAIACRLAADEADTVLTSDGRLIYSCEA
jgi:hypothetical protein